MITRNKNKKGRQIDVKFCLILDIILEAVKIHNLFIRQTALEFNMSYCALNRYCEKVLNK